MATTALQTWASIAGVVALAIAGEVLIAAAMRNLGDLDRLRTRPGILGYLGPVRAVLSSPHFAGLRRLHLYGRQLLATRHPDQAGRCCQPRRAAQHAPTRDEHSQRSPLAKTGRRGRQAGPGRFDSRPGLV